MSSKQYCVLCLELTPTSTTTTVLEISILSQLLVPTNLEITHENETCPLCDECALNYHQMVEIQQQISKLEDQVDKKVDVMRTAILNSEKRKKEICGDENILKMREHFFPFTADYENEDELEIKTEELDENCADETSESEAIQNWHVIDDLSATVNDDSNFDPPNSDDEDNESSSSFCILPDPLLVRSTRKRKIPPQPVKKSAKRTKRPATRSHPKDADDDTSSEPEEESENDDNDKDEDWTEDLEEGNLPVSNQCGKCGSEFLRVAEHQRRPHPYPCSQCSLTFITHRARNTHQEKEHAATLTVNPRHCVICKRKFCRVTELEQHMVMKHETDEKHFTCAKCGKGFSLEVNFQRHSLLHELEGVKPLVCPVCDSRYANQDKLDKHVKSHDKLPCELCDAVFASREGLVRHIRFHKGEKPYKCDHCDEMFIDVSAKQNHTLRAHLSSTHRLNCDLCEKTFLNRWGLANHVDMVHKRIKKVKCASCEETFFEGSALRSHRIQQHGDDPLICDECGAKYISIGGLKKHKRTHSGVKSVPCDLCDALFWTKAELEKHKLSHSDVRHFVCNHCGKGFKTRANFGRHLNDVHKEKLPMRGKPRGNLNKSTAQNT